LHHLRVIPSGHPKYDEELASDRAEVRTRLDLNASKLFIKKAVEGSEYPLTGADGDPARVTNALRNVSVNEVADNLSKKRKRSTVRDNTPAKKGLTVAAQTPERKTRKIIAPLTPPATPENENAILVYDMTHWNGEVLEIVCDSCI
jgi:hypothetical protein